MHHGLHHGLSSVSLSTLLPGLPVAQGGPVGWIEQAVALVVLAAPDEETGGTD